MARWGRTLAKTLPQFNIPYSSYHLLLCSPLGIVRRRLRMHEPRGLKDLLTGPVAYREHAS